MAYYYYYYCGKPLSNMLSLRSYAYAPIIKPFSLPSSSFRLKCSNREEDGDGEGPTPTMAAAFGVLGVEPGCSADQLKAAFRAKVKEFHPDVRTNHHTSDLMIRRVIQAYQILSNISRSEIIESECLDPFDNPECEALDVFVNQLLCIGKELNAQNDCGLWTQKGLSVYEFNGCPYSCVMQAPHAFAFSSLDTACATSQGHGQDYRVQMAVGQCPRSCIHYVTPSQRIILEELLDSILDTPYDTSAEANLLFSLIVKATYENNRYQKPKKQPKTSTRSVDWF